MLENNQFDIVLADIKMPNLYICEMLNLGMA